MLAPTLLSVKDIHLFLWTKLKWKCAVRVQMCCSSPSGSLFVLVFCFGFLRCRQSNAGTPNSMLPDANFHLVLVCAPGPLLAGKSEFKVSLKVNPMGVLKYPRSPLDQHYGLISEFAFLSSHLQFSPRSEN